MKHLDLFTGILGFSYAAEQVWGNEYELVACCEIDKFCQKVIRKHRPNVEIVEDVRSERIKQFRDIDLLSAGVPCQPASVAGKKRGTADERWLWPETLAIIGTVRPRWALLENVPGLFSLDEGLAFNGILSGLAEIGYDCWWETIPACAVGAPHRRDRIWIVAYSINNGHCKEKREVISEKTGMEKKDGTQHSPTWQPNGTSLVGQDNRLEKIKDVADNGDGNTQQRGTSAQRSSQCTISKQKTAGSRVACGQNFCGISERTRNFPSENVQTNVANACASRLQGTKREGICRTTSQKQPFNLARFDWWAVEPAMGRVADGVPNRVDRLKSLGNAIVPTVAMVIMQAIKEIERTF
ncbi:MAG: DNA cytosine methyltransferase [Dehalococcoidia bacterium]|nr:DNA cytosine methyltransferase [Dehalococcoidia bacterium]